MASDRLREYFATAYKKWRRVPMFFQRFFGRYQIRRQGWGFKIVIPEYHSKKLRYLKYIFTAIGLFSSYIYFQSAHIAFAFGLVIYLLTLLLEKTAFSHAAMFIHPLPKFEIGENDWLGVGWGYAAPPNDGAHIPLVSMMLTKMDLAKNIAEYLLQWTNGKYDDVDKNIEICVVVVSPSEYIFLCYPNFQRPRAARFFQSAKDKLRNSSLEDEIAEHHIALILGKRCFVGRGSYFPEFRQRYRGGVPVVLEFLLPPFDPTRPAREAGSFVIHNFSIKDKSELTKKDVAYSAMHSFRFGGKWQGPEELKPRYPWYRFW